ncbi:MAG: spermidine/putrescine ABC transporter substrate-binding protein [Elusimicrobia bacterium]|nr:spermidine/putrescine ABC transporter substrate-binding protein [Elusimicrobiota bacterium]
MAEPRVSRRDFLRLGLLLPAAGPLLSTLAACAKKPAERVVNFFNWSSYISKEALPGFTAATGVKVNYDVFADEEEMFAKLRSGAMGYDVIVATDYLLPRLRGSNLIAPIPMEDLKNLSNLDPKFLHTPYDPEQRFSVPYLWGTTGIGFNKKLVAKAPTSWWDLWDERYKGRICMLDSPRECIGTALLLKGQPETTTDEKDFEAAKELLLKQKPLVKQYTSATYVDALVAGEAALAMAYSGDVLQAVKENPHLDYALPKEGGYMWVDCMCVLRGAPHLADSVALIDYLLRPDVAAGICNAVHYASPNAAAQPRIDPAVLKDKRVYPPAAVVKNLRYHTPPDPEAYVLWNQTWSDVKAL